MNDSFIASLPITACCCCCYCSAAAVGAVGAAAAAGLCSAVRCLCCVVAAAVRAWISERAGKRANERADEQASGRRQATEAAVGGPSGWALSGTPHTAHDCSGWDGLGYEHYSNASERVEVLGAACGSGCVVDVCRGPGYVVVARASKGTPVARGDCSPGQRDINEQDVHHGLEEQGVREHKMPAGKYRSKGITACSKVPSP